MERLKHITIIFLLAIVLPASAVQAKSPSLLLQEGLYAEEIKGDLDKAIEIYEQVISSNSSRNSHIAEAMYRLGMCYIKKQDEQQAKVVFEKLVARFGDQTSIINRVRPLLDEMSSPDPAVLMPPETLIYLETGSPGHQIETILNMLRGTPFANPLAVIGSSAGANSISTRQKSPGDIMAAVLNPSMMAEFKKIRGMAVGITDIRSNNPPLVAVLYPGKSDALRGILLAGLGIAGKPGAPIEGMQTLMVGDAGGVAYDDTVIIISQPMEQLVWCVKQYKGITNEPTLVSKNKAFSKISRKMREENALTIWVDVDKTFAKAVQTVGDMPDEFRIADGIADFKSIDDIITHLSIQKSVIAVEANVAFKDGHHCLAYDLIRTPNLSRGGFEAVSSEAVGLVSLGLGEAEGAGIDAAKRTVKRLTGLDIGREIFANIEQVNLFALPPGVISGKGDTAQHISSCFALAVTSSNPAKTHQLVTELLTLADLVATNTQMEENSVAGSNPAEGKYLVALVGNRKIYCYVGQVHKTTVVALSRQALRSSISAIKNRRTALTAGPLQQRLNNLPSDTSKLALVNVGGAMRIADAHINWTFENPQNPAHTLLEQLAQSCDKTTVQFHTGESLNNFNLQLSISGLPPLDSVFPVLMQLSQIDITGKARATKPQPSDGATAGLTTELNWKAGVNAVSHKVYFGTDADKLSLLSAVKGPEEITLPALKKDATYYWRVDEVAGDGSVITGDVWSFTVGKLVAWWKLDESTGSTALDSAGDNDGSLVGEAKWQSTGGKVGGAILLDGSDDYIKIGNESTFDISSQITVTAWIKVNAFDRRCQSIVTKGNSSWRLVRWHNSDYLEWACTGISVGNQWGFIRGKKNVNDGEWHHVAGVYDGKKTYLYIDGELDASRKAQGRIDTTNHPVYIGADSEIKGRCWNGLIDDVRVYNYALLPQEIDALCRVTATKPQPVDGAAVGPGGPDRLSWKPAIGADSYRLYFGIGKEYFFVDGWITKKAEVDMSKLKAAMPEFKKNTKYYWRVDKVQADGSVVLGDLWSFTTSGKLAGWWKLDESGGTGVSDSSGNSYDGTRSGGNCAPTSGKFDGAVGLGAANTDYVEVPTTSMSASAGTISLWGRIEGTQSGTRYFFGHTLGSTSASWPDRIQLYMDNSDNQLDLGLGNSHTRDIDIMTLSAETWYHIALTWNGSNYVVYVDGTNKANGPYTGLSTLNSIADIGNDGNTDYRIEAFQGLLDDVRIYNYALSQTEITAIYEGKGPR